MNNVIKMDFNFLHSTRMLLKNHERLKWLKFKTKQWKRTSKLYNESGLISYSWLVIEKFSVVMKLILFHCIVLTPSSSQTFEFQLFQSFIVLSNIRVLCRKLKSILITLFNYFILYSHILIVRSFIPTLKQNWIR